VVVDVEEDFDWSGPFSSDNPRVDSLEWINLGHTVMKALGVRPAYLLTYPTVKSPRAVEVIRALHKDGSCEIGAQLHPWVTPPFDEEIGIRNSFPSNLTPEQESKKIECLVNAIVEAVGAKPRIYKAGRYGLSVDRATALADLGFVIDTSVMPHASFESLGGGPDFFGFPDQPFWLTKDRRLLGIPTTQRMVGLLSGVFGPSTMRRIFARPMERLHVPGMLARLGLLERLRLSPEGFNTEDNRRLVDECLSRGATCFVLSFHSPSLRPGCTPYVRNQKQLNEFMDTLFLTLKYLIDIKGARPTALSDLYSQLHHT